MKKQNFFLKNKTFTIFGILAILIVLAAIFAPLICGGIDPTKGSIKDAILPPSAEHIFGTDKMGRDIFARVIYGARASLISTFAVVIFVFVIGSILGVIAGYFGGVVDAIIMRLADIMIAFPGLILAIAVAGIMGASVTNAVIAVGLVTWPKYARMARALVLKIRHRDYVYAAVVTGSKNMHIIGKYMIPNVLPTMVITATTDIGAMMLQLASLSFLGFGAVPPAPEWGLMLSEGRAFIDTAPWMMIYPGIAIFITVVVFNMLGDSVRDILDPRDGE